MKLITAKSSVNSVTTVAVQIWSSDATRVQGAVESSNDFAVGGSDLDSSNGLKILGGRPFIISEAAAQAELWAIATAETISVSAIEFKVL